MKRERHLLYCKWALKIIIQLSNGPKRPSQLLKAIPDLSEKVLYHRLKTLNHAGLLIKRSNNRYPLVVYYRLSNLKFIRSLLYVLRGVKINIDEFVSIISKKWVMDIMRCLQKEMSPQQIISELNSLTYKVLYERLGDLERLGYVSRIIYNTKPVKVNYRLTKEGVEALPILIKAWKTILSI